MLLALIHAASSELQSKRLPAAQKEARRIFFVPELATSWG